jgi:hypothetical protein
MKRDVVADIDFIQGLTPPTARFFVQARLSGDDAGRHPYGEWSLAVEPVAELFESPLARPMPAFVEFVSPEAPHDLLRRGAQLVLFRGQRQVGTAFVTLGRSADDISGLPLERDFLPSTGEEFLGAA